MINTVIPLFIDGYFDEKVDNMTVYKDNKFTFLSNTDDNMKYIFEEMYVSQDDSTVIIHEGDDSIPLRIESNEPNFEIELTINTYTIMRLNANSTVLTYRHNFKIGDNISYVATKSGFISIVNNITITDENPIINLSFVSNGSNTDDEHYAKIGFKSNYVGTIITVTWRDTDNVERTQTKTTQTLTGIIYFDMNNPATISYTAVAGNETLSDSFEFNGYDRVITLTFENGSSGNDFGGNTEEPGDGGENNYVEVTGINVILTTLTLHVGDEYQLIPNVLPSNATNKTVYWSILNNDSSGYEEIDNGGDAYENASGTIKLHNFKEASKFNNVNDRTITLDITANCAWTISGTSNKLIFAKTSGTGNDSVQMTMKALNGTTNFYTVSLIFSDNGRTKVLDTASLYCIGNNVSDSDAELVLYIGLTNTWEYSSSGYNDYGADELDINFYVWSALQGYEIICSDNWFSLTGGTTGSKGYGIFNIHCDENNTGYDRTGTITVRSTSGEINASISDTFTQSATHFDDPNPNNEYRLYSSPARVILDVNEGSASLTVNLANPPLDNNGEGVIKSTTALRPYALTDGKITSISPNKYVEGENNISVSVNNYDDDNTGVSFNETGDNGAIYFGMLDHSVFIRRLPVWSLALNDEFKIN